MPSKTSDDPKIRVHTSNLHENVAKVNKQLGDLREAGILYTLFIENGRFCITVEQQTIS